MGKLKDKYKSASRLNKIIIKILAGFFLLLLFTGLSAEFTSRPDFCSTCHYMEPFYESWKTSTHKDVTCVKCHFPPGLAGTVRGKLEGLVQVVNYVGQSYMRRRPWAEIADASCLESGCHETRLLKGQVIFKGVVFDHEEHLGEMRRGKNLRCTSCHSQIVQGDHMVVTETTCFLCHFKKGGEVEPTTFRTLSDCRTCHHWESIPKEEMSQYRYDHTEVIRQKIECVRCHNQTIVGDGFVPRENCYSCHFDHERLGQYEDTPLLHKVHISEHKIECIQCHLRIQHKVQKLSADVEVECATCHSSTHKEQLFLFTGEDFNGAKGMPNPMFEAGLNCASCHIFHESLMGQADVKIAKPQSCESCHGEGYAHLLALWEEAADKKLVALNKIIMNVEGAIQDIPDKDSHEALINIRKAKNGLHVVEAGKAIHNITYSEEIIRKSYEYLEKALELAKSDFLLPKFASSPVVPSECANCHTGMEEISRSFEGRQFSHEIHLVDQQLKCNSCHSNARKHGELTLDMVGCSSCHHRPAALENCESCHKSAAEIYSGDFQNNMTPDIMREEEVECVDCHLKDNKVVRPEATVCLDCHDEGYDEMAVEWKSEVTDLLREIDDLLTRLKSTPGFTGTADVEEVERIVGEIKKGAARGVHNYELTTDVLLKAKTKLLSYTPSL